MTLIADTGALIAFDRGDRGISALLDAARRRGDAVITSSGCVAQAWRAGGPRQALLAKLLQSVDERAIAPSESRSIAALCAKAAKSDIVDGHVALLASAGDTVLTSDTDDLRALLHTLRIDAVLHQC